MAGKQKKFPKVSKKIRWFLTDESGKITKKDALGLSAGATLLAAASEVSATNWWHASGTGDGHFSHAPNPGWGHANVSSAATCPHVSGLVNGHLSSSQSPTANYLTWHGSHGSHGSHWSHGSHGSHGSHSSSGSGDSGDSGTGSWSGSGY